VQIDLVPSGAGCPQAATRWQSRQFIVTPELLGVRSTQECDQRAAKLGLTALPSLPRRQEYWRLDVLLAWSRANGLDRLPWLGQGSAQRLRCAVAFRVGVKLHTRSPLPAVEDTTERLHRV
jgi:hypothetical protein